MWQPENPIDFTPNGDRTNAAIAKHINEFLAVYGHLNALDEKKAELGPDGKLSVEEMPDEAIVFTPTGAKIATVESGTTFTLDGAANIVVGSTIRIHREAGNESAKVTAISEEGLYTLDAELLLAEDVGVEVWATLVEGELDVKPAALEVAQSVVATQGYRNVLINGAMEIAQRGTTFTGTGYGSLDRWRVNLAATLTQSIAIADILGVPGATACMKLIATTVNGMSIAQRIENAATFSGEKATASFWAKGSKAQTVKINLTRSAGGTIALSEEIEVTTEWQRYEITFDVPETTTRPAPTTTYLQLEFAVSGTTVGDVLYLARVQVEAGEVATAFEQRNYGDEMRRCQRYFESINCNDNGNNAKRPVPALAWSTDWIGYVYYAVEKRVVPTVTIRNSSFAGYRSGGSGAINFTLTSVLASTLFSIISYAPATSSTTLTVTGVFGRSNVASGHLWFDAEL